MDTTTRVWGSLVLLTVVVIVVLLVLLVLAVMRSIHRSMSNAAEGRRKRKEDEALDPWVESGRRVREEEE